MEVQIAVNGDLNGGDSLSLRRWLRQEEEEELRLLPGTFASQPGTMGAVTDSLVVAVGSGGAITALATSVGMWLSQVRNRPGRAVTVKITLPTGTVISVKADQTEDPASVIHEVLSSAFNTNVGDS